MSRSKITTIEQPITPENQPLVVSPPDDGQLKQANSPTGPRSKKTNSPTDRNRETNSASDRSKETHTSPIMSAATTTAANQPAHRDSQVLVSTTVNKPAGAQASGGGGGGQEAATIESYTVRKIKASGPVLQAMQQQVLGEDECGHQQQQHHHPVAIVVEPRNDESVQCDCQNCQFFSGWCCMPCALVIIIVLLIFWATFKTHDDHTDHSQTTTTMRATTTTTAAATATATATPFGLIETTTDADYYYGDDEDYTNYSPILQSNTTAKQ